MRLTGLLLFVIIMAGFSSCRQNSYVVNVNNIELDVGIFRLEEALFETDPSELRNELTVLKDSFDYFIQLFSYVIDAGLTSDDGWYERMIMFCTDRQNSEVYEYVKELYPDLKIYERELAEAWKHYLYHFPERNIPQLFSFISGFNNSIVIGDSILAIGLDRYLGADNEFYPRLGIYNYLRRNMRPEKIISDCMYAWGSTIWELEESSVSGNSLLDIMIHQGKLLYFTKCMVPLERDSLLFGFISSQMKFCLNNESQMWEYLIEHDLLFNSDPVTINKLTGEAPFTAYFTNESPGKAVVWIGFRIVESFMKNNPGIDLKQLMEIREAQTILNVARYSP